MAQLVAVYWVSLILRSIGIALIAGICCWKIRNAAVRHAVWVAVLGAMLLLPVCDYFLPDSWVPAGIQQITIVSVRSPEFPLAQSPLPLSAGASPIQPEGTDWWNVAAALYVLVAAAMFVRLFWGYRKVRQLLRRSNVVDSKVWDEILAAQGLRFRIPTLRESEAVRVPMTVGYVRPIVILPADWSAWDDWKLRAVLLHELAHVRRGDWGIAVIAAAARCAFWLNPLSWFLERQLSKLAEQSSDDASLAGTQNVTRYAEILLEFAAAAQNGRRLMRGGVAMAQHGMKARIERVLGSPVSGTGIVKMTGWMLVLILAAPVIYSAAALQIAPKPALEPKPTPQIEAVKARPAVELERLIELSVQSRSQQQRQTEAPPTLQALIEEVVATAGPEQQLQGTMEKVLTAEFLQQELQSAARQLNTLQSALQQLTPNMPDNEAALRAYLESLARLRVSPDNISFAVSVTGIQGRTMTIRGAGQDYSLGCANCSFFVGESAVSNASAAPATPGVFLRLSPDGSSVSISCRAAKCSVAEYEVLGDGTEQVTDPPRQMESGLSESFRTAKRLRIVITKHV
jgi:beta-lactamase regulating signal transducer with metallopeptidase domain